MAVLLKNHVPKKQVDYEVRAEAYTRGVVVVADRRIGGEQDLTQVVLDISEDGKGGLLVKESRHFLNTGEFA